MRVLPFCYCSRSRFYYYTSLAAILFFPFYTFQAAQYRKCRPPREFFHSLSYCITSIMDSLWTERWYHSSGMSAGFSVSASFAFIYLAALPTTHKDCVFGECPCHDVSWNVSQNAFSSRWHEAWVHRRFSTLAVFATSSRILTCKVTI